MVLCVSQGVAIISELLLSRGVAVENSFAEHLNSTDFAQTMGQLGAGLAVELVFAPLTYLLLSRMAARDFAQMEGGPVTADAPMSAGTAQSGHPTKGFHPLTITRQTLHHVGWCLSLVTFSTLFGFAVLTDPSQSAAYISKS